MPTFARTVSLPVDAKTVFGYHASPGALRRLIPPWADVRVVQEPASLRDGSRAVISVGLGPIRKTWVAEHFDFVESRQFCDRQIEGPFQSWTHTHRFADAAGGSRLEDRIDYRPGVGMAWLGPKIRGELARGFAFRHTRTRFDLTRHAAHRGSPPLTIAITGASGAIGSELAPFLTTAGHSVLKLVRGGAKASDERSWSADSGAIEFAPAENVEAVVHLAGKNIATRWTDTAKREIRESRVDVTRKLCEHLASLPRKPRVLICASAVGYYGDRGEESLDENAPPGEGWLEQTCVEWENATRPAREAGIRVVNLRTAVVLSARHGALGKMLLPAKLGVAGRVGSGTQWMPWISMDDHLGVIYESLFRNDWSGPINSVTGSVRQADFIRTLGKVLHRPAFLPLPRAAVSLLFGEMGRELLLGSTRVEPAKLKASGFEWMLPDLEGALRFELGRMAG